MSKRKSAKDILENVKAREELERRGWSKKRCDLCKGLGILSNGGPCLACDGTGGSWVGPMIG